MTVSSQKTPGLTLAGDWSVAGIADQWAQVSNYLSRMKQQISPAASEATDQPLLLDMSGIETLDACGCQLLAIFVRDMQEIGIATSLSAMPEPIRCIINTLGFTHYFQCPEADEAGQ